MGQQVYTCLASREITKNIAKKTFIAAAGGNNLSLIKNGRKGLVCMRLEVVTDQPYTISSPL